MEKEKGRSWPNDYMVEIKKDKKKEKGFFDVSFVVVNHTKKHSFERIAIILWNAVIKHFCSKKSCGIQ